MSALVLSLLGRSRHLSQKVVRLGAPCLPSLKRLESHGGVVTFVYRTSSAGAASPSASALDPEAEEEVTPTHVDGKEHLYYHAILERSPACKPTIFSEQDLQSALQTASSDAPPTVDERNWPEVPKQELLEVFCSMATYAINHELSIDGSVFVPICKAIKSRIKEFSAEELLEIGKVTRNLDKPTLGLDSKHSREITKGLNDAWVMKYRNWSQSRDLSNILKAADMSYWLKNGNRSYLRCMVNHTAMKVKEPHHMLQLMFYLGLIKPLPSSYKVYDIEKKIFSFRKDYSISELLLFVNAIFRSKSRLQYEPLVEHLLIEILTQFPSLDDLMLITVSKGCNSAPQSLKPLLAVLQRKVMSKINDFRIESIIHVLWMSSSNNVIEENFAQATYERAIKEIGTIRWKELSRLLILFAEHPSPNRDMKHFGELVIEQMESRGEIKELTARKVFVQGAVLHRLLLCGLCPRGTLDAYFNMVNSDSSGTRAAANREAVGIDVHLEVFYPEYEGVRLSPEIRKEICQEHFQSKSSSFKNTDASMASRADFNYGPSKKMHPDVLAIVGSVEDNIHFRQLVPSFGFLDYMLCLSKDGTYVPIPAKLKECEPWKLPYIPEECLEHGNKFIAVTFFNHQAEFVNKRIVCLQREKTEILQKLGYIHVEVAIDKWFQATPALRQETLKNIIAKKISEQQES